MFNSKDFGSPPQLLLRRRKKRGQAPFSVVGIRPYLIERYKDEN